MKSLLHYLGVMAGKVPGLDPLVEKAKIAHRFKIERALLKNAHRTTSTHPSILHFTVNKSASQHVMDILFRCGVIRGMTPVRFHAYAFSSGTFPYLAQLPPNELEKYHYLFKPEGYIYSAFNEMLVGIPEMERYRIILMLRDPRDVLVSAYFSYAYSHNTPPKVSPAYSGFVKQRQLWQKMSLDDYVRSNCESVQRKFEQYDSLLLQKYTSCVHFTKYELMVSDYRGWLRSLLDFTGLDIPDSIFREMILQNESQRRGSEDIHKQRRLGRPGEFHEKLSKETIIFVNEKLQSVLSAFNYEKD